MERNIVSLGFENWPNIVFFHKKIRIDVMARVLARGTQVFFADSGIIFVSTCSSRQGLSEKLNFQFGGPALFYARTRFTKF